MADTNQEYGTVIGADASFKGELNFESAAKVLGRFEGTITSKGRVLVADGSKCKASVKAKEIAVEGQIEGNVEATDRLELKPKGVVMGDVTAARMVMADGASIEGHCRIGVNGQARGPGGGSGSGASTTEVKSAGQTQPASAAPVVKK